MVATAQANASRSVSAGPRVLTKARGNLDVDLGGKQVWCHEFRLCVERLAEAFEGDMIPAMGRRETGAKFSMESFLKAYEVKDN